MCSFLTHLIVRFVTDPQFNQCKVSAASGTRSKEESTRAGLCWAWRSRAGEESGGGASRFSPPAPTPLTVLGVAVGPTLCGSSRFSPWFSSLLWNHTSPSPASWILQRSGVPQGNGKELKKQKNAYWSRDAWGGGHVVSLDPGLGQIYGSARTRRRLQD